MPESVHKFPSSLNPCLADLLRSCRAPSSLLLRIEHVFGKEQAGNPRNVIEVQGARQLGDHDDGTASLKHSIPAKSQFWSIHLALSDGQLQIQTVLAKELRSQELLRLRPGDLVEVKDFQLRSAPRLNGLGQVIYLGFNSCEWVGRDETTAPILEVEGGFIREEEEMEPKSRSNANEKTNTSGRNRSRKQDQKRKQPGGRDRAPNKAHAAGRLTSPQDRARTAESEDSDDDWFGTISVSQTEIERRREVLRRVERTPAQDAIRRSNSATHSQGESKIGSSIQSQPRNPQEPDVEDESFSSEARVPSPSAVELNVPSFEPDVSAGTAMAEPQAPPTPISSTHPLHSLYSLLSPPTPLPRRNYTCAIFAVVTWVSPSLIHRPNTPFPPKRHIKIHDPSISHRKAGITVAVFLDAKNFVPRLGTVALMRGLVMQRWESEVILNKYATVSGRPGDNPAQSTEDEEWFVTDEKKLVANGFDFTGMKLWWESRSASKIAKPL